jgi:hypothetical protein
MTPGHDGTGRYLSEDSTLYRRWEETMGGTVYVAANSNLTHQESRFNAAVSSAHFCATCD